jgi:pantothenate kinase
VFEFGVTGIGAKLISLEKNIEKRMIKSLNILGSGNVAHFFLDRFFNKIEIKSIYCHSKSLDFSGFDSLQNKVVNDISELKEADLNIICVNDSAIEDVAKKFHLNTQ